jgi:hypothetical protein
MNSESTTPISMFGLAPERQTRTLAELAVQQGLTCPQDFDALFGAGSDLWLDEADFDAYLADLRESRREGG